MSYALFLLYHFSLTLLVIRNFIVYLLHEVTKRVYLLEMSIG